MPSRRPTNRRLVAKDIIDQQAEVIRNLTERHTSGAPQVAVDLTRNAKGDVQIGVKVTANMDADPKQVSAHAGRVLAVAVETFDKAAETYPAPVQPAPAGKAS